jgi:hypothetical protein
MLPERTFCHTNHRRLIIKGTRLSLERPKQPQRNRHELLAQEILAAFLEEPNEVEKDRLLLVAEYRQSLSDRLRLLGDREFTAGLPLRHRLLFRVLVLRGAF